MSRTVVTTFTHTFYAIWPGKATYKQTHKFSSICHNEDYPTMGPLFYFFITFFSLLRTHTHTPPHTHTHTPTHTHRHTQTHTHGSPQSPCHEYTPAYSSPRHSCHQPDTQTEHHTAPSQKH